MHHLDHVALVVRDLDQALDRLATANPLVGEIREFPREGTREVYLGEPDAKARLLLMQPLGDAGPYARALARRGPGLHHVAFQLPDPERFLAETVRRSSWTVHPASFETWKTAETVWLTNSATDVLVELHQGVPPTETADPTVEAIRLRGLESDDLLFQLDRLLEPGDVDHVVLSGEAFSEETFFTAQDVPSLRHRVREFIDLPAAAPQPDYVVVESSNESGYSRLLVEYEVDGDVAPAYLLVPEAGGPRPGVLIHHQHNGERHLGKSEVVGLAGDPLQAFGPALARRGFVVLAPDSICFEDRRRQASGIDADPDDGLQHLLEFSYRTVQGDTLGRKVVSDAMAAFSVLLSHPSVNPEQCGVLGHSYGGNTVLFQAAVDDRVKFACASGAACSYRHRINAGTGIELAQVIPGFAARYDFETLLRCAAPLPYLIASATDDKYSADAPAIVDAARPLYHADALRSSRHEGGHALTRERFDEIVEWVAAQA